MEWLFSLITIEQIQTLLGETMRQDVSKHTVAFIIAWQLVKRDMKKGLKLEFSKLTDAIESVGLSLAKLNTRVEILEKNNNQGGKDATR